MRFQQYFAVLAITLLQLFTASAQTSPTRTSPSGSAYKLSAGATEVEKLTQSGVGDDVVLSYIRQSQVYYNLSAADIVALKNAGVSSQAVTVMLNHDSALRTQQQSSSPATAPAAAPQTTAQFDATAPTAIANPTSANTTVVVQSAPPPQVEVIPVTPGPDYVWTPGFWSWNSGAWIWIGGYWHYPSRPGHVWIGGHWAGHGRGRAWVGGYWR